MFKVTEELFKLRDLKYKEFHYKLVPTIDKETIIGVRVPEVRRIAKNYINDEEINRFMSTLPHKYYDENMLHAILISEINDYDICIKEVNKFLPYIDNWAVCDIMTPKVFKKNKDKLIIKIMEWIKSEYIYECRFAIKMLMNHYLDNNFKREYLDMVVSVKSEKYYINMMISWFFAESLVKQWDTAIKYIENNKLDRWVHNKAIQKARESYRISEEKKEYLKSLKF